MVQIFDSKFYFNFSCLESFITGFVWWLVSDPNTEVKIHDLYQKTSELRTTLSEKRIALKTVSCL